MTIDTVGKLISMLDVNSYEKRKKKSRKERRWGTAIRRQVAVMISVVRGGSLEKVTM